MFVGLTAERSRLRSFMSLGFLFASKKHPRAYAKSKSASNPERSMGSSTFTGKRQDDVNCCIHTIAQQLMQDSHGLP